MGSDEYRQRGLEHAAESARALILGDYSLAAAEAHRAYQDTLCAEVLRVAESHG